MPMRDIEITVNKEHEPLRLDKFIADSVPELSRMQIKNLLNDKAVLVNGEVKKPSYHVKEGELVTFTIPEEEPMDLSYHAMPLNILYEDAAIIVVEKPSGLITHPSVTTDEATLLHGLMNKIDHTQFVEPHRAGVVHRLDKDTSGLLVFAKTPSILRKLQAAMKKRTIKRLYLAITDGVIDHNRGKIDAPIGRHPKKRHLMHVLAEGKDSVTYFKVLERFEDNTFIECDLESGRTHQIRVHMQYIEKPILGDSTYGRKKQTDPFGQYLHAYKLSFNHPVSGEPLSFETDMPKPFQDKLMELRQR